MAEQLTFDELALIAGGHTAFQLLWAGINTGVFDALAENPGLERAQLAAKTGPEDQPTRILLSGLATLRQNTNVGLRQPPWGRGQFVRATGA